MKILFLLTNFLFLFCLTTIAQAKDTTEPYFKISDFFRYDTMEYIKTGNESWAKNSKTKTFENQGNLYSTYFAINNDSTFVFLSIFEGGEFFTTGKWAKLNDTTYTFNWTKDESIDICKSREKYERYYKYSSPIPLEIANWVFTLKGTKMFPLINRLNSEN